MNLSEWLNVNKPKFGSDYEIIFAENVLPLVAALRLESISLQYPFQDMDKKQRYCDFVIQENEDVRIAIEIDGYDKSGTGVGMSHSEFVDWQRRQSALTSQGWYVLRFANRDVRDNPQRCAEHISLLLKRSRSNSSHSELSAEEKKRLAALTETQNKTIEHLSKETSVMKYTVASFTALIFALVMVIVWQSSGFSAGQRPVVQSDLPAPQSAVVSRDGIASSKRSIDAQSAVPTPQPAIISTKEIPSEKRKILVQDAIPTLQTAISTESSADDARKQKPVSPTCDNPISWQQAKEHIGRTAAVVGPLMRVTIRENVQGNPIWIDIGAVFPNANRLALVIWGENKNSFPMLVSGKLEGMSVCIIGQIESFRGTPQIVMSAASQFKVMR